MISRTGAWGEFESRDLNREMSGSIKLNQKENTRINLFFTPCLFWTRTGTSSQARNATMSAVTPGSRKHPKTKMATPPMPKSSQIKTEAANNVTHHLLGSHLHSYSSHLANASASSAEAKERLLTPIMSRNYRENLPGGDCSPA